MSSKKPVMTPEAAQAFLREALDLERQAHQYLIDQKHEQAYEANRKAAGLFQEIGKHDQAGFCFTLAASCWNKHIGQLPLAKAADSHEQAGQAFLKARDYHSAVLRFSDAAHLHEKEGDYSRFSRCFYASKCAEGRDSWEVFLQGKGLTGNFFQKMKERLMGLVSWKLNFFNRLLWGYGERPFRTFGSAAAVIFFCAFIHASFGPVQTPTGIKDINFWEGLYLSTITFATVGYGDYLPVSLATRMTAIFEAFSGVLLIPLFLVALTRRYLRTSR